MASDRKGSLTIESSDLSPFRAEEADKPANRTQALLPQTHNMSLLTKINVRCEVKDLQWAGVLPVLESLFPVKFGFNPAGPVAEHLILEAGRGAQSADDHPITSSLILPQLQNPTASAMAIINVKFSDDAEVPFPFRGRSLRTNVLPGMMPFTPGAGERLLAGCNQGALWTVRVENRIYHFRSAFSPAPFRNPALCRKC